ncbi:MAG: methyl-accepting chemotaxis protein [Lachnospiraceae bacterium]|jgi:hypothetical protein|nr:methyl-accepting chemotaxis protein [Lachnospiraceae bacterium]MBF1013365.1 methyl-accepting chemotaxis protein [Lachnospiraceae bacterium]
MKKSRVKSIKILIMIGGFLVISLICGIILIISSILSKRAFLDQVDTDMMVISKQTAEKFSEEMSDKEDFVKELAANPILTNNAYSEDVMISFFEARAKKLGFIAFYKSDKKGKGKNLTKGADYFDVSDQEFYKQAMQGKTYTTPFSTDKVTGKKIFIVGTPYYTPDSKEPQGVFAGIIGIDFVSDMCSEFSWGKSGNIAIYDYDTNLVGHTDHSLVDTGLNLIEKSKEDKGFQEAVDFFKQNIDANTDNVGIYRWFGKKRVGALSHVEGRKYLAVVAINENELYANLNELQRYLILTTVLLICFGVFIIYLVFARRVAINFNDIKTDLLHMADYDMTREPSTDYSQRADEVGDIYRATQTLKNNIKDIISKISDHAQNTAATAEELSATAQSASASSSSVANAVENIAKGAAGQAEDTQDATKNVEGSNELLKQMMSVLEELDQSTELINEKKDEGNQSLEELAQATNKVTESSKEIAEIITQTDNSADKISSASDMIQSISDQTNLLALNAAIEAARAGEAGKGFAVVAEEIRKLAEQSAGFTGDIKKTITALQEQTKKAVHTMDITKQAVSDQEKRLQETGEKFHEISDALEKSKEIVHEVSQEAENIEQKNGSITQIISNLSAVAQENASTTEEVSASVDTQVQAIKDISGASESLAEIATGLQQEVARFKI